MPWYSSSKKRIRRRIKKNKRLIRRGFNKTATGRFYNSKYNRRYKIMGPTPDYIVSPIDAVPYVGPARKVYKGYKYTRRTGKNVVRASKAGYRSTKSRGRRKTSSPNRRNKPRGTYYYYRGKRYYRR